MADKTKRSRGQFITHFRHRRREKHSRYKNQNSHPLQLKISFANCLQFLLFSSFISSSFPAFETNCVGNNEFVIKCPINSQTFVINKECVQAVGVNITF